MTEGALVAVIGDAFCKEFFSMITSVFGIAKQPASFARCREIGRKFVALALLGTGLPAVAACSSDDNGGAGGGGGGGTSGDAKFDACVASLKPLCKTREADTAEKMEQQMCKDLEFIPIPLTNGGTHGPVTIP